MEVFQPFVAESASIPTRLPIEVLRGFYEESREDAERFSLL